MGSKRVTGVRFDAELEKAVREVVKQESVDKSTALRMLVGEGYREWKLRRALQQLKEGKVSLWQASKIAGVTLWDFLAVVKKEEGIEWAEFDPKELLSES
jgi:predicted HTH domain antitoxin